MRIIDAAETYLAHNAAESGADALIRDLLLVAKAADKVVETFKKDEAQGYHTRDRKFAIEVLSPWLTRS